MKTRSLAIAAVAAALACGGAWFGISRTEAETETLVRDHLSALGVKTDSVDFSLIGEKLDLSGVSYSLVVGDVTVDGTLSNVSVSGFNPDCLASSANSSENVSAPASGNAGASLPLVAKSILVRDGSYTVAMARDAGTSEASFAELHLANWRQNLGSLADAYARHGLSAPFFEEAYRYSLDDFYYTDYALLSEVPELPEQLEYRIARMGLLGKAGSPDGDGEAGRTLSLYADDLSMKLGGLVSASCGRMEWNDVLMPSPQGLADLMPLMEAVQAMPREEIKDALPQPIQDLWDWAKEEYAGNAPYSRFFFRDFVMRNTSGGRNVELAFDELENTLAFGVPLPFTLRAGLKLDPSMVREDYYTILNAYMPAGPKVDLDLKLSLQTASTGESTMDLGVAFPGLGSSATSTRMTLDMAGLEELFDPAASPIDRIALNSLHSVIQDEGGLVAMLLNLARPRSRDSQELRSSLAEVVEAGADGFGAHGAALSEAALTMLDKPGTLDLTITPFTPTPLSALAMMLIFGGAQDMDLQVSASPGPRDLLDYVPDALK